MCYKPWIVRFQTGHATSCRNSSANRQVSPLQPTQQCIRASAALRRLHGRAVSAGITSRFSATLSDIDLLKPTLVTSAVAIALATEHRRSQAPVDWRRVLMAGLLALYLVSITVSFVGDDVIVIGPFRSVFCCFSSYTNVYTSSASVDFCTYREQFHSSEVKCTLHRQGTKNLSVKSHDKPTITLLMFPKMCCSSFDIMNYMFLQEVKSCVVIVSAKSHRSIKCPANKATEVLKEV
jgi:hypothetical protein